MVSILRLASCLEMAFFLDPDVIFSGFALLISGFGLRFFLKKYYQ
jgi:hypothetical protein